MIVLKNTKLESIELRGAEATTKGSKSNDVSSVTKVISGVAQCLGYNPPSSNDMSQTVNKMQSSQSNITEFHLPKQIDIKISNILSIEVNSVSLNKMQLEALNMGLDGNRSVI